MKYIKTYKLFESVEYYDKDIIHQLSLDLMDDGFLVDIREPSLNNLMRLEVNIIHSTNQEKAEPYQLGDIKETLSQIVEYMDSEGYFVDQVMGFQQLQLTTSGPTFKELRQSKLPQNLNEWDENQQVVSLSIYFDRNLNDEELNAWSSRHLKKFESVQDYESIIRDILIELEDDGLQVKIEKEDNLIEVYIKRPLGSKDREIPGVPQPPGGKYPGNLFFWYEIKDVIIRLNDWFYEYSENELTPGINYEIMRDYEKIGIKYNSNSPFRMFNGYVEFGIGWHKPEDFNNFDDYISFTNLRIENKKIVTPMALSKHSRRSFLRNATLATAGISIIPSHAVSGLGHTAPSDKLNIAGIGIGAG